MYKGNKDTSPCTEFYSKCKEHLWYMIKIFYGGERGGGWGRGGSEGYLKWGGGGPLRDLSKNILKQGVGKGKICS